jgi:hypothetical protein
LLADVPVLRKADQAGRANAESTLRQAQKYRAEDRWCRDRPSDHERLRLRGEEIKPSLKLNAVVHDSILLALTILAQIEKRDV